MIMSRRVALAVAGVAAAAVVGTAGVAAATAPAPSGTPAPSTSAPSSGTTAPEAGADRRAKPKHRALGRGMHGEFVVKGKDGKPVTLVSVRGEVTAVSASSITIKAEDGFTATYAVGSETKVRGKDADAIADVEVGDSAAAVGVKSGNSVTARVVGVRA